MLPSRHAPNQAKVVLDLVGEVYALLDLEAFRPGVLEALGRAIPIDWASMNTFGPSPEDVVSLAIPPIPLPLYEAFAQHAHEHPLVTYMERTGDGRPRRLSDVIDRTALRSLQLYRKVYAPIGLEYQVAFTLPAERGKMVGIALSRRHEDFTDEECALLGRARPHLVQAYLNAIEHTTLLRRLGEAPAVPPADLGARGLTAREAEVIRRIASGRSNRDIAADLGVSERTVQKHLERAYRKLGVHRRSDAARIAWQGDGYPPIR